MLSNTMPKAPALTFQDQEGTVITLASWLGQQVVLVFLRWLG